MDVFKTIYSITAERIGSSGWAVLEREGRMPENPESFPEQLMDLPPGLGLPPYLADLARIERAQYRAKEMIVNPPPEEGKTILNPSLQLIPILKKEAFETFSGEPVPHSEPARIDDGMVLLWRHPVTGLVKARMAADEDLLTMKMVAEGIDAGTVASLGGIPVAAVKDALDRAASDGLILKPPSLIRRHGSWTGGVSEADREYLASEFFTLQWHVTQACDLHCTHCYDRSDRETMPIDKAFEVLEDLDRFCDSRNVRGSISFSGGNPLLYPHFIPLYRRAAEMGFALSILGNPAPRKQVEELVAIRRPDCFQVSLEGLREANDAVRGQGHFDRTLEFLDTLKELNVYSMVMLTLTARNMDQIIDLGESLRGKADMFHFNRLAMVGEGARLPLPSRERFIAFLEKYVRAAGENPVLGLKESLINTCLHEKGEHLFGGCAGFGCGAAFNFVALLPDGEVHGCRKFPSLVGNIMTSSLEEVYESEAAERYRERPPGCRACPLCQVCGGCMAVVYGLGLDVHRDRDPYCFFDNKAR